MKGDKVLGAFRQFVSALFYDGSYGEGMRLDGTRGCIGIFFNKDLPDEIRPPMELGLFIKLNMANPYDDMDNEYKLNVTVLDPCNIGKEIDESMEMIRDAVQFILNQYLPKSVRCDCEEGSRRFFFNIYE